MMKILIAQSILKKKVLFFSLLLFLLSGAMLYSGSFGAFYPSEIAVSETIQNNTPDIIANVQITSDWEYVSHQNSKNKLEQIQFVEEVDSIFLMDSIQMIQNHSLVSKVIGIDSDTPPIWLVNDEGIQALHGNETILDVYYSSFIHINDSVEIHYDIMGQIFKANYTVAAFASFASSIIDESTGQPAPASQILGYDAASFLLVDIQKSLSSFIQINYQNTKTYFSIEIDSAYLRESDPTFINERILRIEREVSTSISNPYQLNSISPVLRNVIVQIDQSVTHLNYWAITIWLFVIFMTYTNIAYSTKSMIMENHNLLLRLIQRGFDRLFLCKSIRDTISFLAVIGGALGIFSAQAFSILLLKDEAWSSGVVPILAISSFTLITLLAIAFQTGNSSESMIIELGNQGKDASTSNLIKLSKNRFVKYSIAILFAYLIITMILQSTPITIIKSVVNPSIVISLIIALLGIFESILTFAGDIIFAATSSLILLVFLSRFANAIDSFSRRIGSLYEVGSRIMAKSIMKNPSPFIILMLLSSILTTSAIQLAASYDLADRTAKYIVGSDAAIIVEPNSGMQEIEEFLPEYAKVSEFTTEYRFYGYIEQHQTAIRLIDTGTWTNAAYFEKEWFSTDPIESITEMHDDDVIISSGIANDLNLNVGDFVNISTLYHGSEVSGFKVYGVLKLPSQTSDFIFLTESVLQTFANSSSIESRILCSLSDRINSSGIDELYSMFPGIRSILYASSDILPLDEKVLITGRINIISFLLGFSLIVSQTMSFLLSWFYTIERSSEAEIMRRRGISRYRTIAFIFTGIFLWFILGIALGFVIGLIGNSSTIIFRNTFFKGPANEHVIINAYPGLGVASLIAACAGGGILASLMLAKKEVKLE